MDIEAWSPHNPIKKESWRTVLTLAYQSLGVVYGDLSTSPLYVYKSTFEEDIEHSETNEEIFGVLSFVFWTLTLIPLLKYVFIVLRADDNGEGGTFALYSLLCRHARVSALPNALYFSASLVKFLEGAWVPIALSFILLLIMYVWNYGTLKKYEHDVQNKVPINWLLTLGENLGIARVPGVGLIHTELVAGVPAIFSHFVTNLPAFHQVVIFLCIKSVPVPHVRPEERFLLGRVGPKDYRIYRCIARYGYRDARMDDVEFEKELVCSVAEFILSDEPEYSDTNTDDLENEENMAIIGAQASYLTEDTEHLSVSSELTSTLSIREVDSPQISTTRVKFVVPESPKVEHRVREELQELMEAREAGMAFILGHCHVKAKSGSSLIKKLVIDIAYEFLRRNSRGPTYALSFPQASTLEVGMIYRV
ncbi:hypothetical protein Leryth_008406 [Lithospermum erythrorhizon]|nr:hypothetical protein Leryth_008406 [Lithospermum erythrorhizon]